MHTRLRLASMLMILIVMLAATLTVAPSQEVAAHDDGFHGRHGGASLWVECSGNDATLWFNRQHFTRASEWGVYADNDRVGGHKHVSYHYPSLRIIDNFRSGSWEDKGKKYYYKFAYIFNVTTILPCDKLEYMVDYNWGSGHTSWVSETGPPPND